MSSTIHTFLFLGVLGVDDGGRDGDREGKRGLWLVLVDVGGRLRDVESWGLDRWACEEFGERR